MQQYFIAARLSFRYWFDYLTWTARADNVRYLKVLFELFIGLVGVLVVWLVLRYGGEVLLPATTGSVAVVAADQSAAIGAATTTVPHSASVTTAATKTPSPGSKRSTTTAAAPSASVTAPQCLPGDFPLPAPTAVSGSGVQQSTTEFGYQVFGHTPAQIMQQMNRCSPVLEGGQRFSAGTAYTTSWRFSLAPTAASDYTLCQLSDVGVSVRTHVVYPEWHADEHVGADLPGKWARYQAALHAHEQGHISLNQRHAEQILTALNVLPAAPCSEIAGRANAVAGEILQRNNQANSVYDRATGHGASQGAQLQ